MSAYLMTRRDGAVGIDGQTADDFASDVAYYLHQRLIQLSTLRSFTSRTSHIANFLYARRPSINEL